MQQDPPLGYFSNINFHLVEYMLKFLTPKDILNFKLTCSFIQDLTRYLFETITLEKNVIEKVSDNDIKIYLETDISEINNKIEYIQAIVYTKDQGWASAQYSSSWVTLQLYNSPDEVLTHATKENEQFIYCNYKVNSFQKRQLIISKELYETNKTIKKSLLYYLKNTCPSKIGIVQKCQYPGWQCYIEKAQLVIYFRKQ